MTGADDTAALTAEHCVLKTSSGGAVVGGEGGCRYYGCSILCRRRAAATVVTQPEAMAATARVLLWQQRWNPADACVRPCDNSRQSKVAQNRMSLGCGGTLP
jgi:hypothetical protein